MKKLAILVSALLMGVSLFAADVVNNELIPKVSGELRTRVEVGNSTTTLKDKNGNVLTTTGAKVSNNYVNSAVADRARLALTWTKTLGIIDTGIGVRFNLAGGTNYMETMQLDKTYIKVNLPVVSYVYQANKDELELGGLNYIFSPNNAKGNISLEFDQKNEIDSVFIDGTAAVTTTGAVKTVAKVEGFRLESKVFDNFVLKTSAVIDIPQKGNTITTQIGGEPDLKVSTSNIGAKINGILTIDKNSYIDLALVTATASQKNDKNVKYNSTGTTPVAITVIETDFYENVFLGLGIMGKNKFNINDKTSIALEYEGTYASATRKSTIFSNTTKTAISSTDKNIGTTDIGLYAKVTYDTGFINPYVQTTARMTNVKDNKAGNETQVITNINFTPGLDIVVDKMIFETEVNFGNIVDTSRNAADGSVLGSKETSGFYIRERLKYKF